MKKMVSMVVLALLIGTGCQTRRAAVRAAPVKFAAYRVGDEFVLSWPSEGGEVYTIMYSESLMPADWQPLEGYANMPGTGLPMEVRDELPTQEVRYYRLHVGPYPPLP